MAFPRQPHEALYYTTDWRGVTEVRPAPARLRELVFSVANDAEVREADFPECSLHHPMGWTLTYSAKRALTLHWEGHGQGAAPRKQHRIAPTRAWKAFVALAQDDLTSLEALPWEDE